MKINKLSPDTNEYTKIITSIPKQPQALYYSGTLPEKRQASVAIVGTRKPSSYGREVATNFARSLANNGVIVVSGLALGTDAIAHKAALDAGGTTIAVLGNGLHRIYPRTNRFLGERILNEGGAIISEYEEGVEPRPHHFLQRNRIVSGLSDAIIIIEAAKRSGTLNTAMYALEQGRDVFVVPGNITSPLSEGCNALLKQGASPITHINDILETIQPSKLSGKKQQPLALPSNPTEAKIIALIQQGVRDGEQLQKQLSISASEFSVALTMMEIDGKITALGMNRWGL